MKRIALTSISLVACTAEVPETPSYQVDVMPILAANCIRCHGYPTIGGAPAHTRWDSFENVRVDDGEPRRDLCGGVGMVCGTQQLAGLISARVQPGLQPTLAAEVEDPGQMPPRFPLDDYQIDVIARWQDQGANRGAPRSNNQPPTISIEVVEQVGMRVRLAVAIADPDHDLVAGELYARNGATQPFVGPLRTGRFELDWDTTVFSQRGAVPLYARLDDGAGFADYELGTVELQ